MLQIQKASKITSIVQKVSVTGDSSMESYFAETTVESMPANSPFAIRKQ